MDKFKNALVRGVRTYIQVFVGFLLVGWTNVVDVSGGVDAVAAAAVAAVPALLSFIQNALEDNTQINVPKG
jgi:hypothetical protein